jgi:hypothetical protein
MEVLMTTTMLDSAKTATLRIVPWRDEVIDELGHDPRSHYVETFWLPVLGPSTTWLLRRLADGLEASPEGLEIDVEETARALGIGGLGERPGRQSPMLRSFGRCVDFEMAQLRDHKTLAVRRRLPSIGRRHLVRLPARLREQHAAYLEAEGPSSGAEHLRGHGRLLAASLAEIGEDRAATELQLMRWCFHPALARECAAWAYDRRATATASVAVAD